MKNLISVFACGLFSVMLYAQQSPSKQGQTDPSILAPAPHAHPATPATMQRADSPAYKQRRDTVMQRDTTIYRQRHRTDSLPRDDQDPSRIPRMDRDTLRK